MIIEEFKTDLSEAPREVKRFMEFVHEAIEYYRIPQTFTSLQFSDKFPTSGIDVINSTKDVIIIAVATTWLDDFHVSRRIAWHEVSHWKDLLDGWPLFSTPRPKYGKLNYVHIGRKFREKVRRDISHVKLTGVESELIFLGMQRTVGDVAVCRRIMSSCPVSVKISTIRGLAKIVADSGPIEEYNLLDGYRRILSIAMEMEYIQYSAGVPQKYVKSLKRSEQKWLEGAFRKIPQLQPVFENSRSLVKEIKFTTEPEKVYEWTINWIRLLPSSVIHSLLPYLLEGPS